MSAAADEPPPGLEQSSEACEEELDRLYASFVHVVLRKATLAAAGNAADAWDGTQHAFFKAWEHLRSPGGREIRNWQGWLITTAVRHVMRSRRTDHKFVSLDDFDRQEDQVLLDDHVVLKGQYQGLLSAIGLLPERQRQALVLVHVVGCSTTEAASLMKVSPGTVRNFIHQARARLTAMTGEESDA